jgi:hypothetical protein
MATRPAADTGDRDFPQIGHKEAGRLDQLGESDEDCMKGESGRPDTGDDDGVPQPGPARRGRWMLLAVVVGAPMA